MLWLDLQGLCRGGEPDDELAPLADAFAPGGDAPSVHLDELLHHREADPEAPLRASERAVPLGEEFEHLGQLRGRDADALVLDADDDLVSFDAGRKQDVPPVLAVLGRVVQEVHHDLLKAGRVDVDPEVSPVDGGLQRVLSLLDE